MNPSKPDGRWDELADLLGLSDQPAPAPAPPPPAPVSQPDRREVPDDEEEDQPRMEEVVDSADDVISEEDDTVIDESGSPSVEVEGDEELLGAGAPAGEGEDQPRRGKRRRRRGRRRDKDDNPDAPPQRDRPQRDDSRNAPPPRDRQPRQDAPRQERDDEPVHDDDMSDEPAEVVGETTHEPRTAITDEDTDFSDWNVPSWNDLIASLYRPER